MNIAAEQDRNAFSDAEPFQQRRRMLRKESSERASSLCLSSSIDDNDEQKHPFHPQRDNGGAVGSCPLEQHHQGKKLLHVIVALPVDFIFTMIFVQDQVMANVYQARKVSDVVNKPWQEEKEKCHLSRQVTYTMSINVANFGSKLSYVTEMQTIQHSQRGQCYVVVTEAVNSGIPYGDSFSIVSHYCLIKEPDGRTKITVWTQVKYKKPIWGVVKGMLEKNAYNGVEAFEAELLSQITLVAERSERKGNRLPVTTRPKTHTRTPSHGYKRQKTVKELPKEEMFRCNIWISVSMVMAFVMLILSNYILYGKLSHLEERTERNRPPLPSPLPLPRYVDNEKSFESKSSFLQHFHSIQDAQMQTWKSAVVEANQLLHKVQDSLESMLVNLKDNEEAMLTLLENYQKRATNDLSDASYVMVENTDDLLQPVTSSSSSSSSSVKDEA